jgi:hypothetical protein
VDRDDGGCGLVRDEKPRCSAAGKHCPSSSIGVLQRPAKKLWFAKILSACNRLTGRVMMERIGAMPVLFLFVFRFVRLLFSGHQAVAIENAALRMQIAVFSENGSGRC